MSSWLNAMRYCGGASRRPKAIGPQTENAQQFGGCLELEWHICFTNEPVREGELGKQGGNL